MELLAILCSLCNFSLPRISLYGVIIGSTQLVASPSSSEISYEYSCVCMCSTIHFAFANSRDLIWTRSWYTNQSASLSHLVTMLASCQKKKKMTYMNVACRCMHVVYGCMFWSTMSTPS
jgi:hypothetical protein